MFVRKLVSIAFLLALVMPLVSVAGTTEYGSRYPAAAKHKKVKAKKGKKGKLKKAKKGKAKKAKPVRLAKAKKRAKKSHAPTYDSTNGGGEVSHTPPEMKEDLPAPSVESTTEQ